MPTLLSAAKVKLNINLIIMDNAIVGMTGQQAPVASDIAPLIAKAAGFSEQQIHLFNPLPQKSEENVNQLEQIFMRDEPSLIIFKRKCIIAMQRKLYPPEKKEAINA
jgi:TPP-dependent indolepyruvate ferredoxin oxidoreductase alpha subunit